MDIVESFYNRTWRLDPISRHPLTDQDFYNLTQAQFIRKHFRGIKVKYRFLNRSEMNLAKIINEQELRDQLDYARSVNLSAMERAFLSGNLFYGVEQIFSKAFLEWLSSFRLPEYDLKFHEDGIHLEFEGEWSDVILWEIPTLTIISELKSRHFMKDMSRFDLRILFSAATMKLWNKLKKLEKHGMDKRLTLADFGTRRRMSFLFQRFALEMLMEGIDPDRINFIGSSNVFLSMKLGLEAIGSSSHAVPMVLAALASSKEELRASQYSYLERWAEDHKNAMRICLPDTFTVDAYLKYAPDWVADFKGMRLDSGPPITTGQKVLDWYRRKGKDPREKTLIFSDGLDANNIVEIHRMFSEEGEWKCNTSMGWGTRLTNPFDGLADGMEPISIVIKPVEADGRPTVKLSNNPNKTMGNKREIKRYLEAFGARQDDKRELLT